MRAEHSSRSLSLEWNESIMICISWFITFLRTLSYKSRSWRSLNSPLSSLLSGDSLLRDLYTITLHRSNSFASPRALTGNTDAYKQYSAIQFGPTTFQSRWTVWKYCGVWQGLLMDQVLRLMKGCSVSKRSFDWLPCPHQPLKVS